ncbi:MATE family efflux transporter [Salinibacillus aidingensis]|uniref:MATE family efflux transporter n=1 Tax=Salinibacillus aidingensis TaxID=237684 RepID=A0ABN1BGC0_9BACI
MPNQSMAAKLRLFTITWPIFIEVLLQTMMNFADVFMISFISDGAVAAIGVVNQIMVLTFVLFNFTAMGSGVVVSQFVGANKPKDVSITIANAIVVNLLFGLFISIIIASFRYPFLSLFNLESDLMEYGAVYMAIVGGTLFTQAMVITVSSVLQAMGHTKDVMLVVLAMNVLNIFGNYLFIFGALGVPQLNVTGVAIATMISRTLAMFVLFWIVSQRVEIKLTWCDFTKLKSEYLKKILGIGVPAAGEHLSYNTSQITITFFIMLLGASAMAKKVYTENLMALITVLSMSISKGMQIYIGQLVGAGEKEAAYHNMFRGLKYGLIFTIIPSIIFAFFGENLMQIFTNKEGIIAGGAMLLVIGIILQPGKTFNLVIISALRAAGDAKFPVMMGILSMWGISVPLAYILGVHLEFGLIGVWIAMLVDEWFRGIIMLFRWRSRKWEKKALVEAKSTA